MGVQTILVCDFCNQSINPDSTVYACYVCEYRGVIEDNEVEFDVDEENPEYTYHRDCFYQMKIKG